MRFFTNLRPQTTEIFSQAGYQSTSWLLSSHRATRQTRELAHALRVQGVDLMADNGTKPLIDVVLDDFEERAKEIWQIYRAIRKRNGEPSMTSMPDAVRVPARALAQQVANRVDTLHAEQDWLATLDSQLQMDPTHIIAPEDFCIGCLIGLKLDRSTIGWSIDRYTTRNHISLNGWALAAHDTRCHGRHVYVTLAAADYYTARAAGIAAAGRGARNVAVGFAGLNKLQTATEWTSLKSRRKLTRAAGTRYVRLAEILLGIRDGYRESGVRLSRFHGLGLGSRAQYSVLPAALDWWTDISVDATSPLHDAVNGRVLYDLEKQGSNSRVDKIARQVLDGVDEPQHGFFTDQARESHGHDPAAARRWWLDAGRPALGMEHLRPAQPLARALGWLASGPGSSTTAVTRHWIGHNHWVCDELTAMVPRGKRRAWGCEQIRRLLHGQSYTISRAAGAWLEILAKHDAIDSH